MPMPMPFHVPNIHSSNNKNASNGNNKTITFFRRVFCAAHSLQGQLSATRLCLILMHA